MSVLPKLIFLGTRYVLYAVHNFEEGSPVMSAISQRATANNLVRSAVNGVLGVVDLIQAAQECEAALKAHRAPSAAVLAALHIDEQSFRRIVTNR